VSQCRPLQEKSLGFQGFYAAFDAAVARQDGPVLEGGDSAEQNIGRSALDAATPAEIIKPRSFFIVAGSNGFIWKRIKEPA
jgi:hypothetical protein